MNVINKINIDLTSRGVTPRIDAVQFDENSRVAEISVYSGGIPWQIPDGVEISVSYRKPDNTSGLYDTLPNGNNACTFSGHIVRVMFAPQMLTVPGLVSVAVILYSDGAQLATFPFSVNVEPNPSAGGGVSNDYYNYQTIGALNEAIGDISDLNTIAKKNLVEAINEINSLGGGTITAEQIKEAVNEYLEQNQIETTPIDATLTQEGQAADAKAVGDALKEIQVSGESAKDVTEAYTASGLSNETDYLLTLTEPGEYLIQRTAENYRFRCQVENVNGALYHWIQSYGNDSMYGETLYIDGALVSDKEINSAGALLDVEIIDGARYPRLGTSPQTLTEEQRENARNNIGAIPTPASAAVGQTIVVKEVDQEGKPTEWGTVDMASGGGGLLRLIAEQEFTTDDAITSIEFTDLDEYEEILLRLHAPYCSNQRVAGATWINGVQYTKDWYNIQVDNQDTDNYIYFKKVADGIYQGHEGANRNYFRVSQIHRVEFTLRDIVISSLKLNLLSPLMQRDDSAGTWLPKVWLYAR